MRNIMNFHLFEFKYVGPRGFKGSTVRIKSHRYNKTVSIAYDNSKRDSEQCAIDYLNERGFNIIGHSESDNVVKFLMSDTFKQF